MLPQTITEKYIKNMNWRDFELFVAKVLTWNDYDAIVTPPSNDEGKDIVAKKNNITFYIECKHWKNQIGREHLEKLVGAAARDGIRNIIFVTTSSYHTNAKSYASDLNLQGLFHLQLLDTNDLLRLCKNHSNITFPTKSTSSVKAHKPINSISASVRIIKLNDVISIKEITETNPHWQLTYPTVIILNNPIAQKKINTDLSKSINWLRGLYEKGEFYNYVRVENSHYYDDKVLSISIWLYRYKKGACGDHSFTWDTVYDLSTGDRIPLSKDGRYYLGNLPHSVLACLEDGSIDTSPYFGMDIYSDEFTVAIAEMSRDWLLANTQVKDDEDIYWKCVFCCFTQYVFGMSVSKSLQGEQYDMSNLSNMNLLSDMSGYGVPTLQDRYTWFLSQCKQLGFDQSWIFLARFNM